MGRMRMSLASGPVSMEPLPLDDVPGLSGFAILNEGLERISLDGMSVEITIYILSSSVGA